MPSDKKPPLTVESVSAAEPFFSRIFVAPILFISFLLSLFLIDRQTYGGIFARSGSKDGYYHSHQKKLAKQEMDEAFQLRKRVIVGMVMVSVMSLVLVVWGVNSVWRVWRTHV